MGPDEWWSLPGPERRASCGGAAWLERLLAGEDVPGGDEDLACDGRFGGVGFVVAVFGVGVEAMPGAVGSPGLLGGVEAAQRSVAGPALDMRPVRELCRDCLITGVSPEYPTSFLAVANRVTSPISEASG